jgi:hypothetical protein
MGMALLQKMGWRPGEGLGKNKEGTLEPLKLEIKMDKKGERLNVDATTWCFIYTEWLDVDPTACCCAYIQ